MDKKKKNILVVFIALVFFILFIILMVNLDKMFMANDGVDRTSDDAKKSTNSVTIDGKSYYMQDVENYLIVGLDKTQDTQVTGYNRNLQVADFISLLSINKKEGKYSIIQINRDTMTKVNVLGVTGKVAYKETMQIGLSHSYGSGKEDSAKNVVDAVSNLLYGVKIDHYITMTMDAVQKFNDYIGGVKVRTSKSEVIEIFGEDRLKELVITYLDEDNVEIKLSGDDALSFVRARMRVGDGTNISRMARQKEYMTAFTQKFSEKYIEASAKDRFLKNAYLEVKDYIISNYTVSELESLFNGTAMDVAEFELQGVYSPAGTPSVVDNVMQYAVDQEDLKNIIKQVLVKEK